MKKFMGEMVCRLVGNHFNETAFGIELTKRDKYTVDFKVSTVHDGNFHEYEGFVGCVGQVVITKVDGKFFDKISEFIELL